MNNKGNILINSLLVLSLSTIVLLNIGSATVQSAGIQSVVFSRDSNEAYAEKVVIDIQEKVNEQFTSSGYYELAKKFDKAKIKDLPNGDPEAGSNQDQLKKIFGQQIQSLYNEFTNTYVECSVSNAVKTNEKIQVPEMDKKTGLPKLERNGEIKYARKKVDVVTSTFTVSCNYTNLELETEPLDFEMNYGVKSYEMDKYDWIEQKNGKLEYKKIPGEKDVITTLDWFIDGIG